MSVNGKWNWSPPRNDGIWRHGCAWLKPLFAAAPWISLALMLSIFGLATDRIALAPGTSFALPDSSNAESSVAPELVALIMPITRETNSFEETVVFFNDSRYIFSDASSTALLKAELGKLSAESETGALLLLADKRVNAGDLLRLVDLARDAGVKSVQIAERRE